MKITKNQFKADILPHSHLVKILWNKIKNIKINGFDDIDFELTLTETMVYDIEAYLETFNQTFSILINQHFLDNLKKVEEKKEIFNYDKNTSLFENSYFIFMLIFSTALFITKWPRIGFVLIFGIGVWHLDYTLQKEAELKQQYIINKPVPDYCKSNELSRLSSFKSWLFQHSEEECFQHYKIINMEIKYGSNIVEVIAALISITAVTLLKPTGNLIGAIYTGLNEFMYFPMAFSVLTVVILFFAIFMIGIFWTIYPVKYNVPLVNEEEPHQQIHYPYYHRRKVLARRKPKMIEYRLTD